MHTYTHTKIHHTPYVLEDIENKNYFIILTAMQNGKTDKIYGLHLENIENNLYIIQCSSHVYFQSN